MDGDKLLHLTELGREVEETIYERHCILTEGLIYLGVDTETAEQDHISWKERGGRAFWWALPIGTDCRPTRF
jgi:Mn-dependent DtxR family transcriptional regulator